MLPTPASARRFVTKPGRSKWGRAPSSRRCEEGAACRIAGQKLRFELWADLVGRLGRCTGRPRREMRSRSSAKPFHLANGAFDDAIDCAAPACVGGGDDAALRRQQEGRGRNRRSERRRRVPASRRRPRRRAGGHRERMAAKLRARSCRAPGKASRRRRRLIGLPPRCRADAAAIFEHEVWIVVRTEPAIEARVEPVETPPWRVKKPWRMPARRHQVSRFEQVRES